MSKLLPTNRFHDCTICGDVSGKCRSSADDPNYFQCMTEVGAAPFEIINGFKHIGPTKNGQWAQFVLETGAPQKSFEERQKDRAKREAEERAIYQSGLSPAERHTAHIQLSSQLDLHESDRADLKRRGLSDKSMGSFISIVPWQILSQSINSGVPGSNGKKILTPYSGYLVPARDIEGQILGFQIRNRAVGQNEPKYPWLSTTGRPVNLQNGELPINYAPGEGTILNLCEGILKPLVASEIHSAKFLGASGGNFASSPEQLAQCIYTLSPSEIVLCPDGGAVKNRQVMHQYFLLNQQVTDLGYDLKIRWWDQYGKADGDIDEISREQFENARLISWADFEAMAPKKGFSIQLETKKVPLRQAVFSQQDAENERVERAQAKEYQAQKELKAQKAAEQWERALSTANTERDRIAKIQSEQQLAEEALGDRIKGIKAKAKADIDWARGLKSEAISKDRLSAAKTRDAAKARARAEYAANKKGPNAKQARDEAIQRATAAFEAALSQSKGIHQAVFDKQKAKFASERDEFIDELKASVRGEIDVEIEPLIITEKRGSTTVTVGDEATVITVDSAFQLYEYCGEEKQKALVANIQAIAIPGRECDLRFDDTHTHPGAIGTQIIAGTLLEKAGLTVTANGKPWTFWRSMAIARIDRLKHPDFYSLSGDQLVDESPWVSFDDLEPGTILNLSAGCGMGKTTAVKQHLLRVFTQNPDAQAEIPGYRISLGQQATELLNEAFEQQAKETGEFAPLITYLSDTNEYEQSGTQICAYPIDSFWRRVSLIKQAIEAGRKVIVFVDEADAVLKHTADGGTLKKRQAATYTDFCDVLSLVLRSGGNIITGEADLTQLAVDAIAQAANAHPSQIKTVEFTHPPKQRDVYFHSALDEAGKPSDPLLRRMAAMDAMRALRGEDITAAPEETTQAIAAIDKAGSPKKRVLFTTTSQTNAQQLEEMAREAGYKVERHDGKTAQEAFSKAFRHNPDKALAESKPDLVILTHSLESGVSIDTPDYFDLTILDGDRLEARALLQMSVRYREAIPVHCYINQRALFADSRQETDPDAVVKEYQAYANDARGFSGADEYFGEETVQGAIDRANSGLGAQLHTLKAKYEARCNQSANNLRSHTIISFQQAGHNVVELKGEIVDQAYEADDIEAYKKAKKAVVELESNLYRNAPGQMEAKDAARVLRSGSATYAERVDARKCLDKASYPELNIGTEGAAIMAFDDLDFVREQIISGHYTTLKAHTLSWMSKPENRKVARFLDLNSFRSQIEAPFTILSALRNNTAKLSFEAGRKEDGSVLYLGELIAEIGESGTNDFRDEKVQLAARVAKEHRALINRHLRIQIKENVPDEIIVNKLLRKFGFLHRRDGKVTISGDIRRWLHAVTPAPHQKAVWEALSRKWTEVLASEGIGVDQPEPPVHSREGNSLTSNNVPKPVSVADSLAFIRKNCTDYEQYERYHSSLPPDLAFQVAINLPKDIAKQLAATA